MYNEAIKRGGTTLTLLLFPNTLLVAVIGNNMLLFINEVMFRRFLWHYLFSVIFSNNLLS